MVVHVQRNSWLQSTYYITTTWVSQHQKGKPFWILLEQDMMGVAVESAGPYANHLYLSPDR